MMEHSCRALNSGSMMDVLCSSSTGSAGPKGYLVPGGAQSRSSSTRLVYAVLLAQVLSIALATTGVSSQALINQGVAAPTTQAFLNYCLLAVVFGTCSILLPLARQRWQQQATGTASHSSSDPGSVPASHDAYAQWRRLRQSWLSFAALALIDVEANVLVTKAYQYTSLTSVTLLDCFTIPCVMLLSWLLLRARYKAGHYLGAVCCIAGLAVLVLGDSQGPGDSSSAGQHNAGGSTLGLLAPANGSWAASSGSGSSSTGSSSSGSLPLLGDSLVLLGALLYGVCNVTQELLLANVQPGQLLAMLGVFGALISGAQAALLEHSMLLSTHWGSVAVLLPMVGFAAAMFAFYSLVPLVLMLGGATVLNLSLLTSDGWAALARYLWFGGFSGWSAYFFVGSLVLVAGGLVVFTFSGSPKGADDAAADADRCAVAGQGGYRTVGGVAAGSPASRPTAGGQPVVYSRLTTESDLENPHGVCQTPAGGQGSH